MTAPNDVKMEIDKPPPYAPSYEQATNQYAGYPPPSQGYNAGGNPGYPPQGNPGYPPQGNHGYPPQSQGGYSSYPQHGGYSSSPPVTQHQPPASSHQVIVVQGGPTVTGNCPVCRQGNLIEEYSCCGICCAIFFFPIGLICCLLMKNKRCSHCNACQ